MTNDHTTKIMIWIHPNPMPMTATPHSTGSNKQNSKEGKQSTNTNKLSQFNQYQQIMILCWIFHDHHDPWPHHQNHDLPGYYPMSPCTPLPPNQPTAFSKLQIICVCDGKSHSTLTLHHPPSTIINCQNHQQSTFKHLAMILVDHGCKHHSSALLPHHSNFSKAKNAKESKEAIKATQPMLPSHHAIFQWLFLYSASNIWHMTYVVWEQEG